MMEKYYYLRDPENHPIVTVCLLEDNIHNTARGIAVCSELDAPNKKVGRAISKGRALKAMLSGNHSPMIREELDVIQAKLEDIELLDLENFKGELNPKLTEYEQNLLQRN